MPVVFVEMDTIKTIQHENNIQQLITGGLLGGRYRFFFLRKDDDVVATPAANTITDVVVNTPRSVFLKTRW